MSTPHPLEEQAQQDKTQPAWDPWKGPVSPHWYSGLGFDEDSHYLGPLGRLVDAAGSGAAKGEAMLGGALHSNVGADYSMDDSGSLTATQSEPDNTLADAISADAKMRVRALTPSPETTGGAVQLMHGLVSGLTEMSIGGLVAGPGGAAAVVGGAEGVQKYNELKDAGVNEATATKAGVVTGLFAGAGAVLPMGFGASLTSKILTGAATNTAFGALGRYTDHQILENAGYGAMADQQKVWDSMQVITDLILGSAFGGLAHLHSPEVTALRDAPGAKDAALVANLADKDRKAAPGVPADPAAANAHQEALEDSISNLLQGKDIDVSDAHVTEQNFVERPIERDSQAESAIRENIRGEFGVENDRDVAAFLRDKPPKDVEPPRQVVEKSQETESEEPKGEVPEALKEEPEEGAQAHDDTDSILAEKPDLMIPDEDGKPIRASDALNAAKESESLTAKESTAATNAAVNCYLRRGA